MRRDPNLSTVQRLRFMLQGHDPLEASWYQQQYGSLDGLVSRYDRGTSLRALNAEDGDRLRNKLAFADTIRAAGFPHPLIYGHTRDGALLWNGDGEVQVRKTFARGEPIVLKPLDGKGGVGIEFLTDFAALDRPRTGDFLLTAFARQADYAARIFPGATNTIRILTVTPDDLPVIAAATHRFGAGSSRGVDNFHAGGVHAAVDLATGRLGDAVKVGTSNRLLRSSCHPETNSRIEGVVIPHWEEVKRLALAMADHMPSLPYIGWDIVVTEAGPVVLEGNGSPDAALHQLHGRLLDNAATRPFYERHIS